MGYFFHILIEKACTKERDSLVCVILNNQ